jgi:hypothetical protein
LFLIFFKRRKRKSSRDSAQTLKSLEGNKRDGEQEREMWRCGERERERRLKRRDGGRKLKLRLHISSTSVV